MKKFSEYCRVVSPEQQEAGPSLCSEMDSTTYHNYIRKAKHIIHHVPEGEKVHDKAKKSIARAERLLNKKDVKEETDNEQTIRHPEHKKAYVKTSKDAAGNTQYKASNRHGKLKFYNEHGKDSAMRHAGLKEGLIPFSKFVQLDERELKTTTYLASVNWRATKGPAVRHAKNRKMKSGVRTAKTQYVTHQNFKTRSQHDTLHLTTRSKHQLTDRWRDRRVNLVKSLKKNKNVHESAAYLKNRQALHDAHAQAGREIGKRERDPELKRIHMHRSRKHAHASKVLQILRDSRGKKK